MKIIERSTKDCENETKALFEQIKPLLDKNISFYRSVCIVKKVNGVGSNAAWFRELKDYAKQQGYEPFKV